MKKQWRYHWAVYAAYYRTYQLDPHIRGKGFPQYLEALWSKK